MIGPDEKKRLKALTEQGITLSLCYGYARADFKMGAPMWSVDVLTGSGEFFDKPFGAETIEQAIWIAIEECRMRGWLAWED